MSNLTPQQQAAAHAPCSVVITAGAGTGKTHMLAQRYLYYLQERGLSPLEIVAVTFTEKAATELRSRIQFLVSQELPERLDLIAELEAAQISTIHALSTRICQEHFQAIAIPADFQVLEDLEGQVWLNDALQQALTRLSPEVFTVIPYSLLQDVLSRLLDDPYTADLALRRGIGNWDELIAQARTQGVNTIIGDRLWHSSRAILEQHRGKEGDKLEAIRADVLEAMTDLEKGVEIDRAIATIDGVNLRVGSKKNWQDSDRQAVKDGLRDLRELVRKVTSQGLFDLALGDADERLKLMLPALSEAYRQVTNHLNRLKLQRKVLTFSDLELYALQALQDNSVREYYYRRWQVFLVDEFQDTNPTQAELLHLLTAKAELTIVGDIKQSIYGFRRADIRVFQQFRDRILQNGGKEVILDTSFRTHRALIDRGNQIFAPLLGEHHQDLNAFRQTAPKEADNYLQVLVVGDRPKQERETIEPNKAQRQRVEAYYLAEKIAQMLEEKIPVFDRETQQLRAIEPRDMAILTRTWQPLEIYGEALATRGIPVVAAGGGNLLATREAKDATVLLRFLANPRDDIALVAVLRSPFFAISDRLLFQLSILCDRDSCWWDRVTTFQLAELQSPIQVLQQLLKFGRIEMPSRVLQLADRLTGYTAVIANLAGAERRLADWRGFRELVKDLEQDTYDLFGVVRRLRGLYEREIAVPRPKLATTNAVSLMTIYAAKGLEWGLVVVADLSKERPRSYPTVLFDSQLGVAIKSKNSEGKTQKPVLYSWLEYLQEQKERAEAVRVLYVALTRARDYLILSAAEPYKGELNRLQRGLTAAQIPIATIPYTDVLSLPPVPPLPKVPERLPPLLLDRVGSGLSELPVTALTDYARCPQRFKLHFIDGHPGIGEGLAYGMQTGTLVHKALEYNLTRPEDLFPFAEGDWEESVFIEAIALAKRFLQLPMYRDLRRTAVAKERQISLKLDKITFNGVIDLVGDNWVLDYKSDRLMQPVEHRWQLWVYAAALNQPQAHIVYLRHDRIHTFNKGDLAAIAPEAAKLSRQIYQGDYQATPALEKCGYCPYLAFCPDAEI